MFRKTKLENGITVVMEQIKYVRSVSLGIWVKVGSRHEDPEKNGISHFIEHMFFKGTKKRTAKDIAIDIDSIGGDINAFTSKEGTTFYIKVLDEFLEKGVELLSDILLHSTFDSEEIEKEKGVIKEEIKMVEDTPDDYVHDLFSESIWGGENLGQPILGRRETIKKFTREDLLDFVKKYYGVHDIVVSCAGNFDHDILTSLLEKHLGSLRRGSEAKIGVHPEFAKKTTVFPRDHAEVHVCLGIEGIAQGSHDRYPLSVLNTLLGASISSVLFQEIREKRGLVYTIQSFLGSYLDTGMWAIYAGTGKKKVQEVIDLTVKELRALPSAVNSDDLERAKKQLKGNLILGLESTSSRMQNIARQELYYGRYFSPDEILKEVSAITIESVREVAHRLIDGKGIAMTVLGPVDKADFKDIEI